MRELPVGWQWSTLGEIGEYLNGRGFKKSEWSDSGRPIIRIQNLTGTSDTFNCFQGEADERHVVRDGDLLVSWAATLGVYIWRGPEAVLNQHIFKVRSAIDAGFHRHLLDHVLGDLQRQTHGSGMVHITKKRFDATPAPLPPRAEQERIVEAIEERLASVDSASHWLESAKKRHEALVRSIIVEGASTSCPPNHWTTITTGEAGRCALGLQRSPKRHHGPNMRPYLRVANVFEDRIDASDVMQMDMSDEEWERFRLHDGDVLLNEGQSPHLLGRPAIYRGDPPDVAFTNSLIRFQAADGVDPEWALLVFRSHMHNRRFMKESQITTNIAHLSLGRLKSVEFPVPPLEEQRERVRDVRSKLEAVARLQAALDTAVRRVAQMRRSVLSAAFSGQLVPTVPADKTSGELGRGIQAEPPATKRRSKKKVSS